MATFTVGVGGDFENLVDAFTEASLIPYLTQETRYKFYFAAQGN